MKYLLVASILLASSSAFAESTDRYWQQLLAQQAQVTVNLAQQSDMLRMQLDAATKTIEEQKKHLDELEQSLEKKNAEKKGD